MDRQRSIKNSPIFPAQAAGRREFSIVDVHRPPGFPQSRSCPRTRTPSSATPPRQAAGLEWRAVAAPGGLTYVAMIPASRFAPAVASPAESPDVPITRVAVVGTGAWWGLQHAQTFAARPDTRLVAVVGRDPVRTAARATPLGATPYVDLDQMLAAETPDLVSVCLPNEAHFAPTLRLIRAGVPLLVEKPLTFSVSEGQQLIAEARDRNLFLAINFNHRYARPIRMAAAAIARGDLGDLTFASWRFGGEAGTSAHP